MSEDSNETLGVEEAYGHVYHNVHKRAFFHRLSQHDIVPQTEKEAEELLDMGSKVVMASANPVLQQAAAGESRFTKASQALNGALASQGLISPEEKQAMPDNDLSTEAQAAAWELAQDPAVFKSAEVLQASRESELVTAEQSA